MTHPNHDPRCEDPCPPQNLTLATEIDCLPGHLGGGCGICAPPMLAADSRIMQRAPHVTMPYMMECGPADLPAASDGRFRPPREVYTLTNTGYNQTGDVDGIGTGNADVQPMHMNSLTTDGYPFKSATLRICGWSCMPRGQPFIPTKYLMSAAGQPVVGCGVGVNGAPGERLMIPEPFSTEIAPAMVSSFFSGYEAEFRLQDEMTKWWAGLMEWMVPGVGVYNGPTPNNAMPELGRMLKLPFCLDIPPQQSRKGIISWLFQLTRRDIGMQVWVDPAIVTVGAQAICNAVAWNVDGTESPHCLVQYFDFMFYGKRICLEDLELKARIQEIMCSTNCDEITARNLCCKLNQPK